MTFRVEGNLTDLTNEQQNTLIDNVKTALVSKLNIPKKDITITLESASIKFKITLISKTKKASEIANSSLNNADNVASFLKEATKTDYKVLNVSCKQKTETILIEDKIVLSKCW